MRLALLFLLPLLASLSFLAPLGRSEQRWLIGILFSCLLLLWLPLFWSFETQSLLIGAWPHYAGVAWMLDPMSAIFIGAVIFLYLPCAWALTGTGGRVLCLFHLLVGAMMGVFLTADLFNLFVMFEVLLLSSYGLFFAGSKVKPASSFIWVNVFASTLFLFFLAYLYRCTGSLNMVDVTSRFGDLSVQDQNLLFVSGSIVFLLKAGLFPFFFWAPHSYASLPNSILAFVSALSSKVGLYAFIRWSSIVGEDVFVRHQSLLTSLAAIGVFAFGLASFRKDSIKRSMIYISLSHVSFLLLGVSFYGSLSMTGALTYFFVDALVIAGLFFFADDFLKSGSPGNLGLKHPLASSFLAVLLLAGAGFPPFGTFWGKWLLLKELVESPNQFVLILVSSLTFLVWAIWYWSQLIRHDEKTTTSSSFKVSLSSLYCVLAIVSVSTILTHSPLIFSEAANQALKPLSSIRTTMEETRSIENYRDIQRELGRFE